MTAKAKIVQFIRWVLRSYQREIKKLASDLIDEGLKTVDKNISSVAKRKIVKDVMAAAKVNNVQIYTKAGADNLKFMVNEYIEKVGVE